MWAGEVSLSKTRRGGGGEGGLSREHRSVVAAELSQAELHV